MIKRVYRVFDALFVLMNESSLLYFNNSFNQPSIIFYMNDFFKKFRTFNEMYEFL